MCKLLFQNDFRSAERLVRVLTFCTRSCHSSSRMGLSTRWFWSEMKIPPPRPRVTVATARHLVCVCVCSTVRVIRTCGRRAGNFIKTTRPDTARDDDESMIVIIIKPNRISLRLYRVEAAAAVIKKRSTTTRSRRQECIR